MTIFTRHTQFYRTQSTVGAVDDFIAYLLKIAEGFGFSFAPQTTAYESLRGFIVGYDDWRSAKISALREKQQIISETRQSTVAFDAQTRLDNIAAAVKTRLDARVSELQSEIRTEQQQALAILNTDIKTWFNSLPPETDMNRAQAQARETYNARAAAVSEHYRIEYQRRLQNLLDGSRAELQAKQQGVLLEMGQS